MKVRLHHCLAKLDYNSQIFRKDCLGTNTKHKSYADMIKGDPGSWKFIFKIPGKINLLCGKSYFSPIHVNLENSTIVELIEKPYAGLKMIMNVSYTD